MKFTGHIEQDSAKPWWLGGEKPYVADFVPPKERPPMDAPNKPYDGNDSTRLISEGMKNEQLGTQPFEFTPEKLAALGPKSSMDYIREGLQAEEK